MFVNRFIEDVKDLSNNFNLKTKKMNPLSEFQRRVRDECLVCHICKKLLNEVKVSDTCHFTGQYRSSAYTNCIEN